MEVAVKTLKGIATDVCVSKCNCIAELYNCVVVTLTQPTL